VTVELLAVEPFGAAELVAALRRTPMPGRGGALPYAGADLRVAPAVDPATLAPAQRYVLTPGLRRTVALRAALLPHGLDLFALDGGAWVRTADAPDVRRPVLPPIVEESVEPGGRTAWLVADGIHRVCAARAAGLPISVVVVRGVPASLPYYAFANPRGWDDVVALDALPDGFAKKAHREPADPRALYRDYNAVFPGVQELRPDTDPAPGPAPGPSPPRPPR
jgi:hypothetical protein